MKPSPEKVAIGWREWVSLPELGIDRIKAKIDTGARSSSMDAENIELFESDGVHMVRFRAHFGTRAKPKSRTCETKLIEHRDVKNSGGQGETRAVIRTPLTINGSTRNVQITLTERKGMKFRMLLGRTAVNSGFLVDPGVSYLVSRAGTRKG